MAHSTLRDVAEACGVSVSTASRALNNRADVSPKTRTRVLEAAQRLGYVPSSLAKGLRSKETKAVGVVVTTILNPFYANVVTGIEEVLSDKGYTILLNSSYEDPELELRAVRLLLEQRVDGLILAPVESEPEVVEFLGKNGVPFVLVGRNVRNVEADHVVCDDRMIGELAAEHLISKGHRKILFINSSENYSSELRLQGFCSALEKHALSFDKDWVRPVYPDQDTKQVLGDALDEGLDPTAVFCFCDGMAIEVIRELNRRGIKIPEEMAVIGVDNLDVTELLNPPLTTLDVQHTTMGIRSAEILLEKMMKPEGRLEQVVLTPRLIERSST